MLCSMLTWNFGSTDPRWSEMPAFEPIIARSASAVRPSEKSSINTNRKSLRAFQWAQDDHRNLPLSPPKGGSKTQNGRFLSKIAVRLKKVCYKVSLYENCQRKVVRPVQIFTPCERSFTIGFREEEWRVGGDPFYLKFLVNRTPLERNRRFEPIIARSSSAVRPSEKSSINTNRKSPMRFPTSL